MATNVLHAGSVQKVTALEQSTLDSSFAQFIEPVIKKIRPLVDCYRRGHITTRPVVAVAGPSGAGKSYLAEKLYAKLRQEGIRVAVLPLDHFLDPALPIEKSLPHVHPAFDYQAAHAFIPQILSGDKVVDKPVLKCIDSTYTKEMAPFDVRDVECLLFDGEYAFADESTYNLLPYTSVRIWVDANDEDITQWAWDRPRHKSISTFKEFREEKLGAMARYRKNLGSSMAHVNFIVQQNEKHDYILDIN